MAHWKLFLIALLGLAVVANYVYRIFVSDEPASGEDIEPEEHEQTFGL